VVELVDALDSKSCSERSAGSSPAWGTIFLPNIIRKSQRLTQAVNSGIVFTESQHLLL
jgi:hypothetical protein